MWTIGALIETEPKAAIEATPETRVDALLAVSVIGPLRFLPDAISTVLLPHLAVESDERAAEVTAGVARQAALQMSAITLALVPLGILFLPVLFGESYAASIVPFL